MDDTVMVEQTVLAAGEIGRRLADLGWSRRGFAEEIGIGEMVLRRMDMGISLKKPEAIEQRERVIRWLEMEERLRAANPMPVAPGAERGGVKAFRRRPSEVSARAEVSAAPPPPPKPAPIEDDETSGDAEVPDGYVSLVLPSPEMPSLELGDDEEVDADVVALVVECLGMKPERIAELAGVPALGRNLRRWMNGADPERHPIRPGTAAWLRGVLEALRDQPIGVTAWVRYRYLLQVWRTGEATSEERMVFDAIRSAVGDEPEGLMEWQAAVGAALRRRPEEMAGFEGARVGVAPAEAVVVSDRRVGRFGGGVSERAKPLVDLTRGGG